jgi:hypothetical protein
MSVVKELRYDCECSVPVKVSFIFLYQAASLLSSTAKSVTVVAKKLLYCHNTLEKSWE